MFSVWVSDRLKYYCKVLGWQAKYEAPVSFYVPMLLILSYYSVFSVRGSFDDKSSI